MHVTKSKRSVISLLKATLHDDNVTPLTPTARYAVNTNHTKQLKFHSTKKTRECSLNSWNKPNLQEKIGIYCGCA